MPPNQLPWLWSSTLHPILWAEGRDGLAPCWGVGPAVVRWVPLLLHCYSALVARGQRRASIASTRGVNPAVVADSIYFKMIFLLEGRRVLERDMSGPPLHLVRTHLTVRPLHRSHRRHCGVR